MKGRRAYNAPWMKRGLRAPTVGTENLIAYVFHNLSENLASNLTAPASYLPTSEGLRPNSEGLRPLQGCY